jgi:hypothetical protein
VISSGNRSECFRLAFEISQNILNSECGDLHGFVTEGIGLIPGSFAYRTFIPSGMIVDEEIAIGQNAVSDYLELISLDSSMGVTAVRAWRIIRVQENIRNCAVGMIEDRKAFDIL